MGDAAEVLTALYEKLAGVAAQAGQPSMLDDNFGLHVKVQNVFTVAGLTTTESSVCRFVMQMMSQALCTTSALFVVLH